MDTFAKYLKLAQSEPCKPFEVDQTVFYIGEGKTGWYVLSKHQRDVEYPFTCAGLTLTALGKVVYFSAIRVIFHPEEAAQFGQVMPIPDKAPVRCWDDEDCEVRIRFFDAKNKTTFMARRERNGTKFNHYELIPERDIPAAFGSRERYEQMLSKLED